MPKKTSKLAGKTLTGDLAEPIDLINFGLIKGVHSEQEIEDYRQRQSQKLFDARRAKIPDLARFLGLDPDNPGYSGPGGREFLLELTLMALAREIVPGFQEKKEGKWPRSHIFWLVQAIGPKNAAGKYEKGHKACVTYLISERPELSKRANKKELDAEVLQLQNRLSDLRSTMEKAKKLAEEEFHKNNAGKIVKH